MAARTFSRQLRALGVSQQGFLEMEFLIDALGLAGVAELEASKKTEEAMKSARRALGATKATAKPANTAQPKAVA
ncbi:MAG: hypothetical protein OXQ30_17235 [Boseongicola sp.]|nr:hypothetical protein [Boseongicola sp.]